MFVTHHSLSILLAGLAGWCTRNGRRQSINPSEPAMRHIGFSVHLNQPFTTLNVVNDGARSSKLLARDIHQIILSAAHKSRHSTQCSHNQAMCNTYVKL